MSEKSKEVEKVEFKVGDTVHLKNNDLVPMTVLEILKKDLGMRGAKGDIRVCWIDSATGKMHKDCLPPGALEHLVIKTPPSKNGEEVKT